MSHPVPVIGYTEDGYVFMVLYANAPGGSPMEINLTWKPDNAREVVRKLSEAIEGATRSKSPLILPAQGVLQ